MKAQAIPFLYCHCVDDNVAGASVQAITVSFYFKIYCIAQQTKQSCFHPHTGLGSVATVALDNGQSLLRVWESIPDMSACMFFCRFRGLHLLTHVSATGDYVAVSDRSGYIPVNDMSNSAKIESDRFMISTFLGQ